MMKIDVLVFAAHPDDAELNCGGIIAALVSQGKSVGVIDLTQGEMGTRGTIQTRKIEAENSSKILGVSYRTNLNLGDSIVENSKENQLKVIREIRLCKPRICITGATKDRHPDHGKATQLCIDSIFYSGLIKIETFDSSGNKQNAWRPTHTLHYMQDQPFEPDFVFDISNHWETKKNAILAFNTQFNISNPLNEPETYISSEQYFSQIESRARYFGHLGGFELGEPLKYAKAIFPISSFDLF